MKEEPTIVDILGTEYKICFANAKDDPHLMKTDGYLDHSTKVIVISTKDDDCEIKDFKVYQDKTIRHEIIHAFFIESGIMGNFENRMLGISETIVDWFAIQAPKIYRVYEELGVL